MLSSDQLKQLLAELDAELGRRGVAAEICLFGGAAMILAFDARESTRDVEAIFVPRAEVAAAAEAVAERCGVPADWLNDAVKGFVSQRHETTTEGLPLLEHVRLVRPTDEYLLAMKCLAARAADYATDGDRRDVELLVRRLNLRTAEDVFQVIAAYYHDRVIPARTRYFVEEIIEALWPADPKP
ncbi:MAG TPA: hypothetical protein VFR86_19235 [Burkholderiaceae bacterium]|nr:hypothetical protein [Burkholderiaceae bacterium]